MVLGAETPVNIRKYGLLIVIYYAKDTAAYNISLSKAETEIKSEDVYLSLVPFWAKTK
jgi:hypothetical protein